MEELLLGALLGALFGVALEQMTSFFGAALLTLKYWHLRGTYGMWRQDGTRSGTVTIRPRLGNRFLTRGSHPDDNMNWSGSFQFEDLFMGSAHGVYRHLDHEDRAPDWGNHYLMLLENGDIAVQWRNVSRASDDKGSILWKREAKESRGGITSPKTSGADRQ